MALYAEVEAERGGAMLKKALEEKHKKKLPPSMTGPLHGVSGQADIDVTETMMVVMTRWLTPTEIAKKVSAILDRDVRVQLINNRLHSNKSGRFKSKPVPKAPRTKYWMIAK